MSDLSNQQDPPPATDSRNVSPLLMVLRQELGLNWGLYKEFLTSIKAAILVGDNAAPLIHQMEPLVQNRACQVAHQGVLFLLRELEMKCRAKRKTTAVFHPPPLDANRPYMPPPAANMLLHAYPPSRTSVSRVVRSRSSQNASVAQARPAPATARNRARSNVATAIRNQPHSQQASQSTPSHGIVMFIDPNFKRDVQYFFSLPGRPRIVDTSYHEFDSVPHYEPGIDDLAVWKDKVEAEREGDI
ncbi:hypothetical protein COCC4DRAFT_45808 [Bipolaris maydis ATCC 48331]|uniref:Uncharacterized protein n=2 Tax=Cochliobolus heterostrophus TaxID=5016 RepID=M2V9K3_COCH5|nr:uncharacterized protein COCC4DRAFT_45808 [Bipolaris maydis ATCC 48331]EMD96647.1 hypothetical protein COCHEDRAFT_1208560 [Bipolaris maydis C5]KAH7558374.1 hypothetical protein BM1_05646 [Bipolaris maydis]ENH98787.1 hypothetical protein COCC4DRAFT_45808 [Bipolaris maydis ATCC 48331]KAJ5031469.1 hypothetical protein J3E73DRAFT_364545 [Bipolaris maydis]KAJ5060488.1 hypothetical protein J3E74DRAFT_406831 [Bipolaris maydis]